MIYRFNVTVTASYVPQSGDDEFVAKCKLSDQISAAMEGVVGTLASPVINLERVVPMAFQKKRVGYYRGFDVMVQRTEKDQDNEERFVYQGDVEIGRIYKRWTRLAGVGWSRGNSNEGVYKTMGEAAVDLIKSRRS